MPLRRIGGETTRGIPAKNLENGQIAEIVDAGGYSHMRVGKPFMRVGADLIALSGRRGDALTLVNVCSTASDNDVRVEVVPNGAPFEITDNE